MSAMPLPSDLNRIVDVSGAPGSVWTQRLLGPDAKRRRRTAMSALATGMMACCAAAMHVLALGGDLDLALVHWWSAFAVAGLAFALVLVRSGYSERFADPSLTAFQMQWSLTATAAAYLIAGELRALVLPVLVIILMFGIFGRDRQQTVSLMLYSMALYTLAVFGAAYLAAPRPSAGLVAAHLTIVLLSLMAGTLMCLQVQSIRARLRAQKRALEEALVRIRDLAMRDELTGLFNRRQMSELMELELSRSERSGRNLLLAQLDIDLFKSVNDRHGHSIGDQALKHFASVVGNELRSGDVFARWGGEEFVLLLSDTRLADASELLERLRCTLQQTPLVAGGEEIGLTASIGWTVHRRGETLQRCLERADQALYLAKREGRNRVVFAAPPVPQRRRRRAVPTAAADAETEQALP